MASQLVGSVLLLIENEHTPSDTEWDEFLERVASCRKRFETVRILILTEGGGPDQSQRERLKQLLGGRPVRSAVVSDSIKVRFIATAIMLINRDHGSFTKREMESAFAHLSLNPNERIALKNAINALQPLVLAAS